MEDEGRTSEEAKKMDKPKPGHRRKERLSLIDISMEDDSLLPDSAPEEVEAVLPALALSPALPAVKHSRVSSQHSVGSGGSSANQQTLSARLGSIDENISYDRKERSPDVKPHTGCEQLGNGKQDLTTAQEHSLQMENSEAAAKPIFRRSKTVGHNSLRKSLAWDKAFLTGEGFLDADELQTNNPAPKTLPELPVFEIPELNKIALSTSTASSSEGERPEGNSQKEPPTSILHAEVVHEKAALRTCSERFDLSRCQASLLGNGRAGHHEEEKWSEHQLPMKEADSCPPISVAHIPKTVPVKNVIEAAIQKGTRLRVPSSFTMKKCEEKIAFEDLQKTASKEIKDATLKAECTSTLKAECTSTAPSMARRVSRRVKDTLGKVLPGRIVNPRSGPESPHDASRAKTTSSPPNSSTRSNLRKPMTEALAFTSEEAEEKTNIKADTAATGTCDSSNGSCQLKDSPTGNKNKVNIKTKGHYHFTRSNSKMPSVSNLQSLGDVKTLDARGPGPCPMDTSSTTVSLRSKPSGLRMPSPKLGFFDSLQARAFSAPSSGGIQNSKFQFKGSSTPIIPNQKYLVNGSLGDCGTHGAHDMTKGCRAGPHGLPTGKIVRGSEGPVSKTSTFSAIPHAPLVKGVHNAAEVETSAPCSPQEKVLFPSGAHHAKGVVALPPKDVDHFLSKEKVPNAVDDVVKQATMSHCHTSGRTDSSDVMVATALVQHEMIVDASEASRSIFLEKMEDLSQLSAECNHDQDQCTSSCKMSLQMSINIDTCERKVMEDSVGKEASVCKDAGTGKRRSSKDNGTENEEQRLFSCSNDLDNSGTRVNIGGCKPIHDPQFDQRADSPSHWSDWPVLQGNTHMTDKVEYDKMHPLGVDSEQPCHHENEHQSVPIDGCKLPLAVNNGLLNCLAQPRKEKESFFAFAKKAVSRLSSTRDPLSDQENLLSIGNNGTRKLKRGKGGFDAMESRIPSSKCPLLDRTVANTAEEVDARSLQAGVIIRPVEHSPPNKSSPKPGPWSPVRKHAQQQLGPFDCTKYMNVAT